MPSNMYISVDTTRLKVFIHLLLQLKFSLQRTGDRSSITKELTGGACGRIQTNKAQKLEIARNGISGRQMMSKGSQPQQDIESQIMTSLLN